MMTYDQIKAMCRAILDKAEADLAARRAAGLCIHLDTNGEYTCTAPPLGDRARLFGCDHCEQHAREAELEMLVEDQQDDADGVL